MEQNQQSSQPSTSSNSKVFIAAAVVVLVVLGALAYNANSNKSSAQKTVQTNTTTAPTKTTAETSPSAMSVTYKDGSYEAVGNYISPGGDETLDVKVTLKNDVITDATVTPQATRPMSKRFQDIFAANYKQYVVGKSIDAVKLDKVSGSSLAPKGFNDALQKIKTQAKA